MTECAVLALGDLRVALPLPNVERVLRAVHVTPLPDTPEVVAGIVNIAGNPVPVFDLRRRLRLPDKTLSPADRIVVARSRGKRVALVSDAVEDILDYADPEYVDAESLVPGLAHVKGVLVLGDRLILVHDLDAFLSLEEDASLDRAMASSEGRDG